ncbi:MAG: NUDIX domain-containing protein [Clostridiales bacterium]|nr:NUDIX domain-containing protein [Clostridiales bacterium]
MEEYWDIYDRERKKTEVCRKRGEQLNPGEYHLIVHVCIFNHKNELMIQQRVASKKSWPNLWDVSAAGCVQAGEDSRQAAEREVREELGIQVDLSDEIPKFSFSFEHGFDDWWMIQREFSEDELSLQKEEVKTAHWASREEVMKLYQSGCFIPYHFCEKLFDMRESMGAY